MCSDAYDYAVYVLRDVRLATDGGDLMARKVEVAALDFLLLAAAGAIGYSRAPNGVSTHSLMPSQWSLV